MNKSGFFLINKPLGWTSFDVVQRVKKKFSLKKAGHAGTLDPVASGLIIVLSEAFTKKFDYFSSGIKEYKTRIFFGAESETDDITGRVTVAEHDETERLKKNLTERLESFISRQTGRFYQIAPKFSSIKFRGRPLYAYARKGIPVSVSPRLVCVHDVTIDNVQFPFVDLTIRADRGFYVRSFSRDIGHYCGTGALMLLLTRTRIEPYGIEEAKNVNDLNIEDMRTI